MESGSQARYLWAQQEKLFLLKMMILRIQQIRRPMEFRREDILFAELQPEIIRSAEIATELNFPLQKTVHAGGTQSDFLIVIPTTIWGSVLPREANIRVSYNNLSGGNGYGIYAVGTEASQKICRIYGNTVSGFMKDGILASGLAAGSRIEHNRVSTSAANGILVKCIDKSVVDGNYSFKNKARGILLQRCESAMVADNFVSENADHGIELNIRSNILLCRECLWFQ